MRSFEKHSAASFNVAASIKMRKSASSKDKDPRVANLQCGRIYKDAEIFLRRTVRLGKKAHLQCGRIYKDAEIRGVAVHHTARAAAFNVAASIKMRKCCKGLAYGGELVHLQCGRIYKDAEIRIAGNPKRLCGSLQCGRIYKDAEIEFRAKTFCVFLKPSMWPHL